MEHVETVTAAVVVGIVSVVAIFFTGLKRVVDAKLTNWEAKIKKDGKSIAYFNGIKSLRDYREIINEIHSLPFVDRLMIFVGRNGGGVPAPGKPYTITCTEGWSHRQGEDPERLYKHISTVDLSELNTLLDLIKNGLVIENTADMPKNSTMRMYYVNEGVKQSLLLPINLTNTEFYYLALAKYDDVFTEDQIAKLTIYAQRLRSVFLILNGGTEEYTPLT